MYPAGCARLCRELWSVCMTCSTLILAPVDATGVVAGRASGPTPFVLSPLLVASWHLCVPLGDGEAGASAMPGPSASTKPRAPGERKSLQEKDHFTPWPTRVPRVSLTLLLHLHCWRRVMANTDESLHCCLLVAPSGESWHTVSAIVNRWGLSFKRSSVRQHGCHNACGCWVSENNSNNACAVRAES